MCSKRRKEEENESHHKRPRTQPLERDHCTVSEVSEALLLNIFNCLQRPSLRCTSQVSQQWRQITEKSIQQRVEDISLGMERVPLPSSNDVDPERFPSFLYITSNILHIDVENMNYGGCLCETCDPVECECFWKMNAYQPYDADSLLRDQQECEDQFIIECNSKCKCSNQCKNRVVQNGVKYKLFIFKTLHKGWAVGAQNIIPKGGFVGEYVGEIISTEEAKRRMALRKNERNYLLILREFISSKDRWWRTNLDATDKGNFTRLINHSCDPNVELRMVRIESPIPRVALFAKRKIIANEELTIDYGKSNSHPSSIPLYPCCCGSPNCRKYLPFDASV